MDRKIPFHVDLDAKMEKRKESMSGVSGSSSSLGGSSGSSDTSSMGRKSSKGPRVCGVIAVAMVIVAVLVGVTIYLIDVEKQKQELAKSARIMEGKETEMDFAEEISDYQEKSAVKSEIGYNEGNRRGGNGDGEQAGRSESHGGHQYEMEDEMQFEGMGGNQDQRMGGKMDQRMGGKQDQRMGGKMDQRNGGSHNERNSGNHRERNGEPKHERLETGMPERANNGQRYRNLDQRQKMYQNFLKGKQEFFRPSEDVETPLAKILEAGRGLLIDSGAASYTFDEIFSESTSTQPTTPSTQPRTTPLETFEPSISSDLEFGGVGLFGAPKKENHRVEQVEQNIPQANEEDPPMTIQSMRRHRPGGSDIYDMSGYVKAPGAGQKGGERKAFPRRNFRMRQRLLRQQGLEGRLKVMAERFPGIGIDNLEERLQNMEGLEGRFPQNDFNEVPPVSFTDIQGPLEEGGLRPTIPLHGGRPSAQGGIPLMQLAEQRLQMMERGGRPMGELADQDPIIHMAERGMETIDRRPGRPAFHHLGPGGMGPNRRFSRRRMSQGAKRHRKGQGPAGQGQGEGLRPEGDGGRGSGARPGQGEGVRQGLGVNLEDQLAAESVESFPPMEMNQEDMLNTFDMFIKLAGSEMGALKDVAKNITSSGEFNLWQILEAVNGTVRQNPESNIAQLMEKFQDKYLSADKTLDNTSPAQAIYERSLSSLLFLSMGIFLLNSVNELADGGMLGQGEPRSARMMPSNYALEGLVTDPAKHHDVLQLFNTSTFDFFETPASLNVLDAIKPRDPAHTVNNYVRLVMNLMNAYIKDSAEFECIYATYCAELNHQAKLGGMASNIAKINSVGLRLALREIHSSATVPAVVRSLFSWSDLPCTSMFPQCDLVEPPQRVDLEKR